jgi:co-chaperonin GroES (HSP10)
MAKTKELRKIKKIVPVGNQVLVERLKVSELSPSSILSVNSEEYSNQAIVLAIGPMAPKDYGVKVGDRVVLQGSFVPFLLDGDDRQKNLIFPDMIKAVLIEE